MDREVRGDWRRIKIHDRIEFRLTEPLHRTELEALERLSLRQSCGLIKALGTKMHHGLSFTWGQRQVVGVPNETRRRRRRRCWPHRSTWAGDHVRYGGITAAIEIVRDNPIVVDIKGGAAA